MNKGISKVIIILVIVIAILGAVGFYLFSKNSQNNTEVKTNYNPEGIENASNTESLAKKYVEYSPQVLKDLSSKRRVLFFFANWCPTCIPVDAELQKRSNELPGEIAIIRVNYNDTDTDQDEKDLATKYGVTYQHTFIEIDKNGKSVKKWNGGSFNELTQELQ